MRTIIGRTGQIRLLLAAMAAALLALLTWPPIVRMQEPTPPETLIGQQAETCWYGSRLEVVVADAFTMRTLLGQDARGNGLWLVLIVDVSNPGTERAEGLFALKVRDERGREFDRATRGTVSSLTLAEELGVKWENARIDPGFTIRAVTTFQVPADARSFG
jgi:hypothetical protein